MGSNCLMVGWLVCLWQYDYWSMWFMYWFLIGQNTFSLQTAADARVAPCTTLSFPNPAKKQEKGEKEKSASPVENVKDEAHLNNPVKDIYMNIK